MTIKKRKLMIILAVVASLLIALVFWIVWGNTALQLNTYTVSSDRLISFIMFCDCNCRIIRPDPVPA